MAVGDGSSIVLNEHNLVVSGGPPGQRKGHPPRSKPRRAVPVSKLNKLAGRLVGLTVEQAQAVVEESGLDVDIEFIDGERPTRAWFRSNMVKAFVKDGQVVMADPGRPVLRGTSSGVSVGGIEPS